MTDDDPDSEWGLDRRTVLKGIGVSTTAGIVGVPALSGQVVAVHNGDLVARYPLDELDNDTVEDTSGNDYDGTAVGSPQVTSGKVNQALDFDGDNDQVTIDPFPDLSGSSVTITAWVYPQSPPDRFSNVISLADQTGSNRTNSILIQHRGENVGDPFLFGSDDGNGNITSITSDGIGTGEWHHVALTQDGEYLKAYLDGAELDNSPVSVDDRISVSTNVARIAQNVIGNSVTLYDAKIDDVRIYDRALSVDEINLLASNLVVPAEYDTIQEAVDDADPGDTIVVESGTYEEDVTVDVEGLTLQGPNAGTCGDDDERVAEATIAGQVVLSADGTTLDGFDVSPPPAESNPDGEAVRISDTPNGVTVQNNIVRDFEAADNFSSSNFEGIEGIVVFGGDGENAIKNVTIFCNQVKNINSEDADGGAAGIMIQGNVDGAAVESNHVFDIGEEKSPWAQGVVITSTGNHTKVPVNVEVTENELSSIRAAPDSEFDTHGVGVGIETAGEGYRIAENEVKDGTNIGVEAKATGDNTTITGNEIKNIDASDRTNNGGVGIFVGDDDTTVEANEVKNTFGDGIRVMGDSNELKENEVKKSDVDGIKIDGDENELTSNEVEESGEDGIHLLSGTSDNMVVENEMKDSADFDAHDDSSGSKTAGTANTWVENECETSDPVGLCEDE